MHVEDVVQVDGCVDMGGQHGHSIADAQLAAIGTAGTDSTSATSGAAASGAPEKKGATGIKSVTLPVKAEGDRRLAWPPVW